MGISAKKNLKVMQSFDVTSMPTLDVCVCGALELFNSVKLPKIKVTYKRPLVVGSGNAEATGRIIFEDSDAIFGSESTFEKKLKKISAIDGVVVISASGGKHAPGIVKVAHKYKKKVTLITCNKNSLAHKELGAKDNVYVFPKQREPYTYNTSTYMGMILGKTKESPKEIYSFIQKHMHDFAYPNFKRFDKFYVIVPPQFSGIVRMLQVKFIELFGRRIARDVETSEYVKHATTVVSSKNELFISIGQKYPLEGKNHLYIPLPRKANYAMMMAISYYLVGKIQAAHSPYFKNHIVEYTKEASVLFGQTIEPIVG